MKFEKLRWPRVLFWFFALFPFLFSAVYYSRLPEQVATHFDSFGKPDGYSARAFAAFGIPGILLAAVLVCLLCFRIDPKYQNIAASPQIKAVILWGIVILSNLVQAAVIMKALNLEVNITVVVDIAVGVLFMAIGNYLPKCKPNYTMGIRLPWTLASEENWRRTHRFAGPVWIIGGILIAVSAFLPPAWITWILLAVTLVLCIVPAVYSYLIYKGTSD